MPHGTLTRVLIGLALVGTLCAHRLPASSAAESGFRPQSELRRPSALVAVEDRLYVANRRSGTISVIDAKTRQVVDEARLGGQPADLAAIRDAGGGFLLAVDESGHQLVALRVPARDPKADGGRRRLEIVQRVKVARWPLDVEVAADGKLCSVTSLWSRRLTFVEIERSIAPDGTGTLALNVRRTIDLPFAPRVQRFIENDRRLVVADAFDGRLAVIDAAKRKDSGDFGQAPESDSWLLSVRSIPGHNIRGLAVSHDGRHLHVAHQRLDSRSSTTHEHVFWGSVMENLVRSVPLDELLAETETNEPLRGTTYSLGHPSGATGDPAAMLITPRGEGALLLSGVDEVALRRRPLEPFVRRDVGRRPTALCLGPEERYLYVANTLDDSISMIDLAALKVVETISLGPQPQLTPADRGESLFYDARLSLDGWYSCHSCHTDGHTNGLLNDNFGDNYFGDPKRVPTLLGTGRTAPWAWNGKSETLSQQIHKSITVTMQGETPAQKSVADVAAFLQTLKAAPGLSAARGTADRRAVSWGRRVFEQRGCVDCHSPPAYTTPATYDVGLYDKWGNKEFNPPSLLGVSQRGPYFHDSRAETLRDVLTRFRHNLDEPLPDGDLNALLAFLYSL